jgi:hypothetical protein
MNPYSFMMITEDDLIQVKRILHIYSFGDLDFIHCVQQLDGLNKITVHYKHFTNECLQHAMDECPRIIPYYTNGEIRTWEVFKTLTPSERTHVHFRPIQRIY